MQQDEKNNPQETVRTFVRITKTASRLVNSELEALERELAKGQLPPKVKPLKDELASVMPSLEAKLADLNQRFFNQPATRIPYPGFFEDLRNLFDLIRKEPEGLRELEAVWQKVVDNHRCMLRGVLERVSIMKKLLACSTEELQRLSQGLWRLEQDIGQYLGVTITASSEFIHTPSKEDKG